MKRVVSVLAAVCLLAAPFAVSAAENGGKFSELYREERFLQTENAGKLSVMYGVSALGTSKGDVCAVSYDRDGDYISYPVTLSFNEKGEKTAYTYVITLPGSKKLCPAPKPKNCEYHSTPAKAQKRMLFTRILPGTEK